MLIVVRRSVRTETANAVRRLAACLGTGLTVLYFPGADLAHYGLADTLAPAGAKAEFVAYVRAGALEEFTRVREVFDAAGAGAEDIEWKLGEGAPVAKVAAEVAAGGYTAVVLCGGAGRKARRGGFTGGEVTALARRLACPLICLP
ncbi:MAG: hypothetical protein AB1776_03135 [Bacillota bacterium]